MENKIKENERLQIEIEEIKKVNRNLELNLSQKKYNHEKPLHSFRVNHGILDSQDRYNPPRLKNINSFRDNNKHKMLDIDSVRDLMNIKKAICVCSQEPSKKLSSNEQYIQHSSNITKKSSKFHRENFSVVGQLQLNPNIKYTSQSTFA